MISHPIRSFLSLFVVFVLGGTLLPLPAETPKGPLKVFLLSGQSNMTGRGSLGDLDKPAAEQQATLVRFAKDPANEGKYRFLFEDPDKTEAGWAVRDDVFITMGDLPHVAEGEEGYNGYNKHGGLSAYYGGRGNRGFGPELAIGHLLGNYYEEPVLLVKAAFGGNSLAGNFRPPSSGGKLGDKYPLVVKTLREALDNLPVIVEGYDEKQGYELVGLLWNQGLSDATPKMADEHETNLVNLINDIRKEFKAPELKVVIGVTGNWGRKPEEVLKKFGRDEKDRLDLITSLKKVQETQLNVPKRPEFKGTVATAETRDFWRPREEHGGRGTETHWMANGESYWLIGEAMGREMIQLLKADGSSSGASAAEGPADAQQSAFPGNKSLFQGEFDMFTDGRNRIVVPKTVAEGKPWVWRARFWRHEPQFDVAMLRKGYHLVYCDVGGLLGNPTAVERWNQYYKFLVEEHGFGKKAVLEGMSRGGMIIYNWAIANPDKVAAIYGDAPVMDLKSWPGAENNATLSAYQLKDAAEAEAYKGYPIDNLKPLAEAGIPIIHVVGDADVTVPVSENTAIAEKRYKEMGGTIEVIHKKETGHHPHSLKDPTPIVEFIEKHVEKKGER